MCNFFRAQRKRKTFSSHTWLCNAVGDDDDQFLPSPISYAQSNSTQWLRGKILHAAFSLPRKKTERALAVSSTKCTSCRLAYYCEGGMWKFGLGNELFLRGARKLLSCFVGLNFRETKDFLIF